MVWHNLGVQSFTGIFARGKNVWHARNYYFLVHPLLKRQYPIIYKMSEGPEMSDDASFWRFSGKVISVSGMGDISPHSSPQ